MSLLKLYTPNTCVKYSFGSSIDEVQANKITALAELEQQGHIIDTKSQSLTDDPTLNLLRDVNGEQLYGNIIYYKKRFQK